MHPVYLTRNIPHSVNNITFSTTMPVFFYARGVLVGYARGNSLHEALNKCLEKAQVSGHANRLCELKSYTFARTLSA